MGQWHRLSISVLLAPAVHTRLSPLTSRAIISEVLAAQSLTHRQPSDICLTRGDPQSVKLTTSGAPRRPDVNASAAARDRPARCIGIEEEVILTASIGLGRELTPKLAVNGRSHERAYDCVTGVTVASSASLRHAGGRGVPVVQEDAGDDTATQSVSHLSLKDDEGDCFPAMPAERFISRLPIKRLIHDSKPSTISRLMV